MMSDLPKVAHMAAGRTLIGWVLEAVHPLRPVNTVVVVGHGAEEVAAHLPADVVAVVQEEQLGTGDAAGVGLDALGDVTPEDTILVLYGDMPLLTNDLLARLADRADDVAARMVTSVFENPAGYGRVIRDASDLVLGVVEERDCDDTQRAIAEINAGAYTFRAKDLIDALGNVSNENAQGEYYLTDVIGILVERGERLQPVEATPEEVIGINSQDQLTEARRLLQAHTNQRLMESGVSMIDPDRTYVDDTVTVAPGAGSTPECTSRAIRPWPPGPRWGPTSLQSTLRSEPARPCGTRCSAKRSWGRAVRWGRMHRCDRARCWRRAPRWARSSRPRTPPSEKAPRRPTSPISATPRSGPGRTLERVRSPAITTATRSIKP